MVRLALFLIVCSFCRPVFAQDVAVVAAKGTVKAGVTGALQAVKVGSRISDGQTVQTGEDSLVILKYADDSRIKLKEKTEVVIHAVQGKEPQGLDIVLGAVFAAVSKRPNQRFQVRTPAAVAGVRGTQFFTSYEKKDVWMCVEEGQVEISENEKPKPVLVSAGFGVLVEKGKAIAPPQKFAWTKKLNWNMDPDKGDVVDKTSISDDYKKKLLKSNYD